jgi:hypothetical protein
MDKTFLNKQHVYLQNQVVPNPKVKAAKGTDTIQRQRDASLLILDICQSKARVSIVSKSNLQVTEK